MHVRAAFDQGSRQDRHKRKSHTPVVVFLQHLGMKKSIMA